MPSHFTHSHHSIREKLAGGWELACDHTGDTFTSQICIVLYRITILNCYIALCVSILLQRQASHFQNIGKCRHVHLHLLLRFSPFTYFSFLPIHKHERARPSQQVAVCVREIIYDLQRKTHNYKLSDKQEKWNSVRLSLKICRS